MPDIFGPALGQPGLVWLLGSAFVAGLIRGFSGFGTAMVYLPVAGQFLGPFEALTTLIVMELIGPLPNVRRALLDGHPRDVLRLAMGLLIALPLGVWVLTKVAPEVFRYGVSGITLLLLVLLVAGVRYNGQMHRWLIYGAGAVGGFLAGVAGLPGPPVIMLYMAAPHPPQVIRANTLLYLILSDVVMLGVMATFGKLVFSAIGLGLFVMIPYLAGNFVGGRLFRPERAGVYRLVAYLVIASSALHGLPIFD